MEVIALDKDYIFEFAGMPKSGKTTVMNIVAHYLKRKGFTIQEYHGGGRYSPIDKSAIGSLNLYLAIKSIEFILTTIEREKTKNKIFFMDRGIFDRCIFTKVLNKMKKIDSNEASELMKFLMLPRLAKNINGIFLFVTSPAISIDREYKEKLIQKIGRVMNTDFLEHLKDESYESYREFQDIFPYIHLIDTDKMDKRASDCAKLVVNDILNRIEGKNDSEFTMA